MYSGIRKRILKRHDFFVEQVRARVFSQFQDIEKEAEAHADNQYRWGGSLPAREDVDMSDVAEWAWEQGVQRYELLSDLKKQIVLGALAGLYHQWDMDLREFVEAELRHDIRPKDAAKAAWDPNLGNVFDILKQFGWDCREADFFSKIEACRLIVNVYKHGKGRSLEELAKTYPEYLGNLFGSPNSDFSRLIGQLDHEGLKISEAQFEQFATGLRTFWITFPERLFFICWLA